MKQVEVFLRHILDKINFLILVNQIPKLKHQIENIMKEIRE
ncbi:MAG: hypothetical protein ABIH18_01400 [Candidatus Omnitrophota bacterium]